jgi:hypothetical protein
VGAAKRPVGMRALLVVRLMKTWAELPVTTPTSTRLTAAAMAMASPSSRRIASCRNSIYTAALGSMTSISGSRGSGLRLPPRPFLTSTQVLDQGLFLMGLFQMLNKSGQHQAIRLILEKAVTAFLRHLGKKLRAVAWRISARFTAPCPSRDHDMSLNVIYISKLQGKALRT